MTLSDRLAIEVGIERKEPFKAIAKHLNRHPSSIAHEVKENRTFIRGSYPGGNDCRFARQCAVQHICSLDDFCNYRCKLCRVHNCHDYCERYISIKCYKWESPPYVCNTCNNKRTCKKDRKYYNARQADAVAKRRFSEARSKPHVRGEELEELDNLVTPLIKKG